MGRHVDCPTHDPERMVVARDCISSFSNIDIIKVYPANRFERLPGGWGIMMDDVVAGLYAGVITQAAALFL